MGALLKLGMGAAIITAAAMIVSSANPAQAQDQRSDEEAIRQVISEMTDGFNRHDAVAATRMYTSDADFVSVRGDKAKGRAETEKFLAKIFATRAKEATLRTEDIEMRFIRPDVAIVHVTNELSGLVTPSGQKLPPHREMSIRVFVKNDDRWQVAAFHNTMVNPFGSSPAGDTGR